MPRFTRTQQRLMNVLQDGELHTREELKKCLGDELAVDGVLRQHISFLRERLKEVSQLIVCEVNWGGQFNRKPFVSYRLVKHVLAPV